jgi:hypothetical protein
MKSRDVMLGSLKLNLSASRNGVTISYYDQDYQNHGGLTKIRIGFLGPDDLRSGAVDTAIDISPILPIATDLFSAAGGTLDADAA